MDAFGSLAYFVPCNMDAFGPMTYFVPFPIFMDAFGSHWLTSSHVMDSFGPKYRKTIFRLTSSHVMDTFGPNDLLRPMSQFSVRIHLGHAWHMQLLRKFSSYAIWHQNPGSTSRFPHWVLLRPMLWMHLGLSLEISLLRPILWMHFGPLSPENRVEMGY